MYGAVVPPCPIPVPLADIANRAQHSSTAFQAAPGNRLEFGI